MWRWSPELDWLVHMTCKRNGKVHNCLSERGQPPPPPSHPTGTLIHWCMATAELGRNLQISRLVPGVWSMRLWVFLLTATHHVAGSRRGARRSESCVLIGFLSRQDGLILPSRDFPLWPRKKSSFRHEINPWHWKQGWLDRYGRINYLLNIWVITFLDRDGWIVAFAFLLTAISNKREFPVVSSRSVKRPKKGPWSITSHLNLTFGQ